MYFRNTVLALGSFLDTFQKIADAASNTKGETPFLGAKLLLRILMRVLMSVNMSRHFRRIDKMVGLSSSNAVGTVQGLNPAVIEP